MFYECFFFSLQVTSLIRDEKGLLCGGVVRDGLTGRTVSVRAKSVVNATGPFCDGIRKMDDPKAENVIVPSSGTHIVLPDYFSPKNMGLLDPSTSGCLSFSFCGVCFSHHWFRWSCDFLRSLARSCGSWNDGRAVHNFDSTKAERVGNCVCSG